MFTHLEPSPHDREKGGRIHNDHLWRISGYLVVARVAASTRCPRRDQNEEKDASPKSAMTVMEEIGVVGLGCGRWEQRGSEKRVMNSKNATLVNSPVGQTRLQEEKRTLPSFGTNSIHLFLYRNQR